jgi:hypothetical protein
MLQKINKFWKKHGFDIVLGFSIFFIVIMAILRKDSKGTWNIFNHNYPATSIVKEKGDGRKDSKGEIECRNVLEKLFKKPFSKARPNILKNPISNFNLEFDCYNEELQIAVEYNGIQHYKYIPHFHRTRDSFQNQKYRDHIKKDLCVKNNIILIEVPYNIKLNDIKSYIIKELKKYNFNF